jgi:transposase
LLKIIAGEADEHLPLEAHASLVVLAAELAAMQTLVGSLEKRIIARHRVTDERKKGGLPGSIPRHVCHPGLQ